MRIDVGTRVGDRPDAAAAFSMPRSSALTLVLQHWPEYLIEAIGLGLFMLSACLFVALLEHPNSPLRQAMTDPFLRRIPMGLAMGLTAVGLIYSPWGQRSGAHLNPSVTLTFWRLGKVNHWDAFFYVSAQFVGAIVGVGVAATMLDAWLAHPAVSYAATAPGPDGAGVALVASYIIFEAPLSGMSMNAARTAGSAVYAQVWTALWIYFTAPLLGMLAAAQSYVATRGMQRVLCAKLHHDNSQRCIFRCSYGARAH